MINCTGKAATETRPCPFLESTLLQNPKIQKNTPLSKTSTISQPAAAAATKPAAKDYDDLFDDDDDDAALMDEGLSDTKSPVKKTAIDQDDADDEDFLMPATGRIRNRGAILDDENSMGERRLAGLRVSEVLFAFCGHTHGNKWLFKE